jgi:hypothetical protein
MSSVMTETKRGLMVALTVKSPLDSLVHMKGRESQSSQKRQKRHQQMMHQMKRQLQTQRRRQWMHRQLHQQMKHQLETLKKHQQMSHQQMNHQLGMQKKDQQMNHQQSCCLTKGKVSMKLRQISDWGEFLTAERKTKSINNLQTRSLQWNRQLEQLR